MAAQWLAGKAHLLDVKRWNRKRRKVSWGGKEIVGRASEEQAEEGEKGDGGKEEEGGRER